MEMYWNMKNFYEFDMLADKKMQRCAAFLPLLGVVSDHGHQVKAASLLYSSPMATPWAQKANINFRGLKARYTK